MDMDIDVYIQDQQIGHRKDLLFLIVFKLCLLGHCLLLLGNSLFG